MTFSSPDFNPEHPVADVAKELVAFFEKSSFTPDGLAAFLGPEVTDALHRGEPAAVARAATGESTLDWLIRFFILHESHPATVFADVMGSVLATKLVDAQVAYSDPLGVVTVAIDIRPHVIAGRNRWVFSDVDAAMVDHVPGRDHVLGVGAATLSLLRSTPCSPVDTVLDLGTGSGAQTLGQLDFARHIVATDVHPRALQLAEATLVGAQGADKVDIVQGSWFEPVQGQRFDRIVANPPFVVGMPEVGHVYRNSGLNLDEASELVVSQAANHLNDGGTAHLLAAWIHTPEQSWQQRVASWIPDHGVSAWILQRDVADPALYVSTWLKDESIDIRSPEGKAKAKLWLDHLAENQVTGIGFGFVALHKIDEETPSEVVAEEIPQAFDDALGPEVMEHFAISAWLRSLLPDELGDKKFGLRSGVAKEEVSIANEDMGFGFTPVVTRLTRTEGPRWSHEVDEHLAAIVAGLNPDGLNLRETIELYAMAKGYDPDAMISEATPAIIDLARHGIVYPAELPPRCHI
ncbi:MAG: class I SAM-dependent methyltransferase [Corynebacterium sp.]|nr:class I SAM-dependent methyltransferase [Corynebacterium sp.]